MSAIGAQQVSFERWWSHVVYLADDALEGRDTGSDGHRKAAMYVAEHFRNAGLLPGAGSSYEQPVHLVSRRLVLEKSSLVLLRNGSEEPVEIGPEAMIITAADNAPHTEAQLVFAGRALVIPEADYNDLAGLDLKGKVVVYLTGLPAKVPGPLGAHYQAIRWEAVRAAGAIGMVGIPNPNDAEVPWERLLASLPQMALADPALNQIAGNQLSVIVNPAHAENWFSGSGHTFKEIADLATAGKQLPGFPLKNTVRAVVAVDSTPVSSQNVIGILPGGDPKLNNDYVVITAHLDHVGTSSAPGPDRVFNGAMDNASGVATLIEVAAAATGKKLRRSVAFVALTAEEQGLLGSRLFAQSPTIQPPGVMVANLNLDMFLPLFPLQSVIVQGLEESDLAVDMTRVANAAGIAALSDPEPERNGFIRSDQYSFIRRGIPALSLKVGFVKGSPEHDVVRKWRAERYHAVSDDTSQPLDKQAAIDFNRLVVNLVEAVANRPTRPQWHSDSLFNRSAARPHR
jgi:Zn-dependent M28 family amino/carboxypeptidase